MVIKKMQRVEIKMFTIQAISEMFQKNVKYLRQWWRTCGTHIAADCWLSLKALKGSPSLIYSIFHLMMKKTRLDLICFQSMSIRVYDFYLLETSDILQGRSLGIDQGQSQRTLVPFHYF